jgi:hypothetical protein
MSLPRDRLLSADEAAEYFGVTATALKTQRWRNRPPGNIGFVVGKKLRFRAEDIEAWVAEQVRDQQAS